MLLIAIRKHWEQPIARERMLVQTWDRVKSRVYLENRKEKLLASKAQPCAKGGESHWWHPRWRFGAGHGSSCHRSHSSTAWVGMHGALSWCTPRVDFSSSLTTLLSFLSSFSQQKDYLVFHSLTWMYKTGRSKHLLISTPNNLICSSEKV